MLTVEYTTAFLRDVKMIKRRGKNTVKLNEVIYLLITEQPLPPKYRNHKLTGNFKDHLECHIEPDWLLIYQKIKMTLILVRTGTHSDLF